MRTFSTFTVAVKPSVSTFATYFIPNKVDKKAAAIVDFDFWRFVEHLWNETKRKTERPKRKTIIFIVIGDTVTQSIDMKISQLFNFELTTVKSGVHNLKYPNWWVASFKRSILSMS